MEPEELKALERLGKRVNSLVSPILNEPQPKPNESQPKKKFEEVKPKMDELLIAVLSGDLSRSVVAEREISQLMASLPDDERMTALQYFAETANSSGASQERKIKAVNAVTSALVTGGKISAGIAQIIGANLKLKGLKEPNAPEILAKDSALATRLGESLIRSKEGDPEIRSQFKSDLAELEYLNNARARSTGNVGQYAANVQSNALRSTREARKFAMDELDRRVRDRAEYDRLLGESIGEDRFRQNERWRQFGFENEAYLSTLNNLQAQKNSGFGNLFSGLNEAPGAATNIAALSRPKAPPPAPEVPGMTIGDLGLLGAPSNRDPESVKTFQFHSNRLGFPVNVTGEWDDQTDDAYGQLTGFKSPLFKTYF